MDTLEIIRKRRSVRRFTKDEIPRKDLEKIVDAGRLAATGSNHQPWDFIVVTDRTTKEQFARSGAWIAQAAAVIVVVMDPGSRWWVEDGSAAIENMLLACTALGYGACWVEGDAIPYEENYRALLEIPDEKRVMALLPIGKAAETPNPPKKTPGASPPLGEILTTGERHSEDTCAWPGGSLITSDRLAMSAIGSLITCRTRDVRFGQY